MPDATEIFDILIIGGGPTGLFASFYAGLRELRTRIIDSLPELGGQLTTIYPEKYIHDIPGFTSILAKDFAQRLVDQAMAYNPSVHLKETVLGMERLRYGHRDIIKLTTEPGGEHYGKTLLITAGLGAFTPNKLHLPEIDRLEGHGVSYYVKEKNALRNKRVLIVGGGDSAVDWTFSLLGLASEITLIHRREQFRAHEENVRKLRTAPVTIKIPYELRHIHGNDRVEEVTIFNNQTGFEERLPVDHIVFSLGFQSPSTLLKEWGLEMERKDIKVTTLMQSNIAGIYAAGDMSWYPGKLKLIVTGMGEAAIAVNAIKTYTDPKADFFPGYSAEK